MDIHCFDNFVKELCDRLPHDWICITVGNKRTFHNTRTRQAEHLAQLIFHKEGEWDMVANPELYGNCFRSYPFIDGREVKFTCCPEIADCIEYLNLLLDKILDTPR